MLNSHIISFNPHINPDLADKDDKLREGKWPTQCLTDTQWQLGFEPRLPNSDGQALYCLIHHHITEGPKCKLQSAPKLSQGSSIFNIRKRKKWSSDFENPHVDELEIENQESLWPSLEIPRTPWILPLKPCWSLSGLFLVFTKHHFLDQWSRFKYSYKYFGHKWDFFFNWLWKKCRELWDEHI